MNHDNDDNYWWYMYVYNMGCWRMLHSLPVFLCRRIPAAAKSAANIPFSSRRLPGGSASFPDVGQAVQVLLIGGETKLKQFQEHLREKRYQLSHQCFRARLCQVYPRPGFHGVFSMSSVAVCWAPPLAKEVPWDKGCKVRTRHLKGWLASNGEKFGVNQLDKARCPAHHVWFPEKKQRSQLDESQYGGIIKWVRNCFWTFFFLGFGIFFGFWCWLVFPCLSCFSIGFPSFSFHFNGFPQFSLLVHWFS